MSRPEILVTGGAGYIGSHTCKLLSQRGFTPVIVDNLVYGHEWAVKWGPLYRGELSDREFLRSVFQKHKIQAVLHFAAYAYVGESVKDPLKYYTNNVAGSLSLMSAAVEAGIPRFVFSSTCATYGEPERMPIAETTPQNPVNPYGASKLMIERALKDLSAAAPLQVVALRYFNACGADVDGEIGEHHDPETHLIPLALEAAHGKRELTVFGTDYPTPDGTCIRDYIHVTDLAEAHVMAMDWMTRNTSAKFEVFNLGTGQGVSVRELIDTVARITGRQVPARMGARRAGDPPVLVATAAKAKELMGWEPRHSGLENIVRTADNWYRKHFGAEVER
ncbi:MAG: UDP-glucose 4-epimerase GalE [Bdellovibrionaceae bacterium]|nr:UDP-glucose 4-epimerase GalE [Pseudobdellovibrionaceae bacterium]